MEKYLEFIKQKQKNIIESGFIVKDENLNPFLFDFQKYLVKKALRKGRFAIFGDCGTGKTIIQLEWANQVVKHENKPVLIITPLAVGKQTIQEGNKFGINVLKFNGEYLPKIYITNYEQLDNIQCDSFVGVVLDESSILKNFEGKTKKLIIDKFKNTPYKLACTATPSPNDIMELTNHAEFLNVMSREEMLAMYFIHDGGETNKWRLKKHSHKIFWNWVSTWASLFTNPNDLGFDGHNFVLPKLNLIEHQIKVKKRDNGKLFNEVSVSAINFNQELRLTKVERLNKVIEIINNNSGENFIVWIKQNEEADYLKKLMSNAVEVRGNDNIEYKENKLLGFANNEFPILITKNKIAQFGMNYQNCNNQIFASLDFCYSEDTQVLTQNGWVHFKDLKVGEVMATINPNSLHFEWQKNTAVINSFYEGEMNHYVGLQNYDLLVTQNHKLFLKRNDSRYKSNSGKWHLKKSKEVYASYKRMEYNMLTTAYGFDGESPEYIDIPALSFSRNDNRHNKIKKIPINDFMMLAGWYLSEGYATMNKRGNKTCGTTRIVQSMTNKGKTNNRKEIENLAKRISINSNIKWKEVTISGSNLAKFMIDNFGTTSYEKKIPNWVKNLDKKHLLVLRDTMIKGDGCHKKGVPQSYRTVCKRLADDFQEICIKTGVRANVKYRNIPASFGIDGRTNIYDVMLAWKNLEPSISVKPKIIQYKGLIGCCSVPNHTLIIRRNGMICVSGNSFEGLYQAIRRSYRFGQKKEVNIYLITTDTMQNVIDSIKTKEQQFKEMQKYMIEFIKENTIKNEDNTASRMCKNKEYKTNDCLLQMGDCVQLIQNIPEESIGFSIFSPPFAELYVYSDKPEDMGNCKNYNEFLFAFKFLVKELYRILWSGRNVAVHCMDLPIQKGKEGYIGLRDFSNMIRQSFEDVGFIYHSRITIWKNPVTEMQRTKALGLLHKQIKKDASMSRVGIPDYVLVFRKDGEHKHPVKCNIPVGLWQQYASPVWMDINYQNTLNARIAREDKDEKHICFATGTLVLTKRGYIPIENLIVGKDYTLTHLGNWKKIINKLKTIENINTIQIKAVGVPKLICTKTHKIWSRYAKSKNKPVLQMTKNEPHWEYAENLNNHFVNQKLPTIIETNLTEKECWIVGRYLADGHLDYRKHQFFISVGLKKIQQFKNIVNDNIGAENNKGSSVQFGLKRLRREVRNILFRIGQGAGNKMLPVELISLNKKLSQSLLDGYVSGDGYVDKLGRIHCSSISRSMLLGLSLVAQRIGIIASIYKGREAREKTIQGRLVNCNEEWIMLLSPINNQSKILNDGAWKKVRKIENSINSDVWTIEVEDDASYTAEGCIVKNCPLQLETIERCIHLWSNEGDTIFTPFMGIGSEVYKALEMNRKAIGFELKRSYFDVAVKNVKNIEIAKCQKKLF